MFSEGYKASKDADVDFLNTLQQRISSIPIQLALIIISAFIVYFNSLSIPFYLDDYYSIVENPAVHSFANLIEHRNYQIMRIIGYFSLASNYAIHDTSVLGYHFFNLLVHIIASISVFFLLRGLIKTLKNSSDSRSLGNFITYLPIIGALFFALHPLQTQAISYIIQRHASLAAMFYIACMAAYVYARVSANKKYYLLTLICFIAALLSKENTVTLPLALAMIEIIFFQQASGRKTAIFGAIGLFLVAILYLALNFFLGIDFSTIDRFTHTADVSHISRWEYFSTQALVVWSYIGLFFWPTSLHLEYDVILQTEFSRALGFALLLHFCLILFALYSAKRRPLIAFAILFYYLAHSIESGIIPIRDYAFEHRTYLPNLGLVILLSYLFCWLFQIRLKNKKSIKAILLLLLGLLFTLGGLTYARNQEWAKPIDFYLNETQHSPNKERAWAELGKVYIKERQFDEALKALGKALNLGRREDGSIEALPTTFLNTYIALVYAKNLHKARAFEQIMPEASLSRHDRGVYYFMRGNRALQQGKMSFALQSYQQSLEINANNLNARSNMAAVYLNLGQKQKAITLLKEVLQKDPQNQLALFYKGKIK